VANHASNENELINARLIDLTLNHFDLLLDLSQYTLTVFKQSSAALIGGQGLFKG
jgi:hypothetical protein